MSFGFQKRRYRGRNYLRVESNDEKAKQANMHVIVIIDKPKEAQMTGEK
jgi:hypothetical protein